MDVSAMESEKLNHHWAVTAIGIDDRKRVDELVRQRLATRSVLHSGRMQAMDESLLERVAFAFELAAIEGLEELTQPTGDNQILRDQAVAASRRAFDIRRHLPVPNETLDRLFFILQLSAMACCGDRCADLQRWYQEQSDSIGLPSVATVNWDHRILYRLFDCWVRLFRKQSRDDADRIRGAVAGLRNDQAECEDHIFDNGTQDLNRDSALRLVALHNWAKATETLASYILQGQPSNPFSVLDKHFDAGISAAAASGDMHYDMILRWLHATARIMATNSR